MTVINKLQQTVASLKSVQASLEEFALDTDNQQAKQTFQSAAMQVQDVVDAVSPRVTEIQAEEPQYRNQ